MGPLALGADINVVIITNFIVTNNLVNIIIIIVNMIIVKHKESL